VSRELFQLQTEVGERGGGKAFGRKDSGEAAGMILAFLKLRLVAGTYLFTITGKS
jgi:hypothetical protein